MPGFIAMAPAAFGVDPAAEGVHAGIKIGADTHAEHPRIIANIDHSSHFMRFILMGITSFELPQAQQMLDAEQEARTSDAADENRDLHNDRE
jgi:hypothetical protein